MTWYTLPFATYSPTESKEMANKGDTIQEQDGKDARQCPA